MSTITGIVVNYESRSETVDLVDALRDDLDNIVVVDNSADDHLEEWAESLATVDYVDSGANLGYSGGNNLGIDIAASDSDYVLLMNPDVEIPASYSVASMVASMESEQDLKILAPLVVDENGERLHAPDPPTMMAFQRLGLVPPIEEGVGEVERTFVAPGCCLLVDTRLLEEVGAFDDRFFLYREEVELCIRARRAGYGVGVSHSERLVHGNDGTVRHDSDHQMYYDIRNRFLLARAAFKLPDRLLAYPVIMASLASKLAKVLTSRQIRLIRPLAIGILDGVLGRYGRRRF